MREGGGERGHDGDADEDARVARGEREREEKRPAQREERPRAHEALEDRVHAAHRLSVGIGHEDDVGHGREDRARRRQEETGPQRAGGPLRLPRPRLSQQQPDDARGESGREREDGLLREDDERERERRKRARRNERPVGARLAAHEGDPERERRNHGEDAEVKKGVRGARPLLPPRKPAEGGTRGARERQEEERRGKERRETPDERGLEVALGEVPGAQDEERGGKVPRVRRDDGREKQAVEQGSRNAPDAAREAEKRHEKRERDGVRVEIPEAEREERPLGDRVRVVDAPRGQPPVEVDERLSRKELPGPVERPAENEKEPAEDRDGRAAPPRADRAEARERREGRQERGDEVVGVLRRHAGRARGKREEVRPEVIVGKALAGEPGIGKRQARGRHEARQDGEVHRLFGLADLAERPADPQEEEEDAEEERHGNEPRAGARNDARKVGAAPEKAPGEGEERERQREPGDRDVEERRQQPAGRGREHEAHRNGEGEHGVRAGIRVRLVAAEEAGEHGGARRTGQEEDEGEEKRRRDRHGTVSR